MDWTFIGFQEKTRVNSKILSMDGTVGRKERIKTVRHQKNRGGAARKECRGEAEAKLTV